MRVSENAIRQVVELYQEGVLDANEICTILTRWVLTGDDIEDLLQRLPPAIVELWREYVRELPDSVEDHLEYQGPKYSTKDQPRFDLLHKWGAS